MTPRPSLPRSGLGLSPARPGLAVSLALVAAVIATLALPITSAWGQGDDWAVEGGDERRDEIISRYRGILERRPERGAIFDRLLQELGGGRRFERTLEYYRQAAQDQPDIFAYPMLLGHLLVHAQRFGDARDAYTDAIAIAPDDPRGHHALADALRSLDLRDEAEAAYERALSLALDDDARRDILRALADLAFEGRDWVLAGDYVRRLIELDPDDVYTRMELAQILVRHARFDDALELYQTIVDDSGRDTRQRAIAIKDIGDVLLMMGRTEDAVESYRRAMRLVEEGYWLRRELDQRIIDAYRQDDRLDELVAEYERRWRSPNLRQLMLLAGLYDELGREEDAIDSYRRALRRDSRSLDARQALIRVLGRRGDMDAVLSEYRTLVRQAPGDAAFRFRLIDVLRRLGRRDDAVEELDVMARRFSDVPHVLVDIAERYLRFGDREAALATYERLVRVDPDEPDNYVALGEFHFMDGRRSEAERIWRRILEVVDDAPAAHAMLGSVLGDHGLLEEAIAEYVEARRLEPDNDVYLRELAKLYDDAQSFPDALGLWGDLLARTDQRHLRAEARSALVRIHTALGQLQDEIPAWRARFEADGSDVEAGYILGEAYLQLDDEELAESVYLALRERDGADMIALQALERLYTRQNRIAEAIDVLVAIAELNPGRAREHYHRLAELSLRLFDDGAAVRFAQLAVELNPDDAGAQARLGDIYRQMQRLDDAVLAYRQALLLDPRAFVHYFELAEVLLALDRPGDADELYRTVLSEANDEVQILRAGRRSLQINQASGRLDELVGLFEAKLHDPQIGETCLKLLVELYDRMTMPLIEVAEYGLGERRESARARLDEIGRRALRPLLDALSGEDLSVRATALRILAAQRNPNAALPIARLLDEADTEIRLDAALAVARIADERAAQPLIRAVGSGVLSLRLVAAWALSRIGSSEALEALEGVAGDVSNPASLRSVAILGLGNPLAGESARRIVGDALFAESPEVQMAGLVAAGVLGLDERSADVRLLLQHGRDRVPRAAAWSLGALGPSGANVAALAEAYIVGTADIRTHAAGALGRVGRGGFNAEARRAFDEAMPFIDRRTDTFYVDVYLDGLLDWQLLSVDFGSPIILDAYTGEISRALGIGLASDRSTLLRVLSELDAAPDMLTLGAVSAAMGVVETREHAAFVRAVVEPHAERLVALVEHDDPRVRRLAISVVSKLGGSGSREVILRHLGDAEPEVVGAALLGLARVGDASDVEAVAEFADNDRWVLRAYAIGALGTLGGARALDVVVRALAGDPYVAVRVRAVAALVSLSPDEASEVFRSQWDEAPTPVRLAMLRSAAALPLEGERELRILGLSDGDPRVRALARRTAGQ